jgi:hypothetical protein
MVVCLGHDQVAWSGPAEGVSLAALGLAARNEEVDAFRKAP